MTKTEIIAKTTELLERTRSRPESVFILHIDRGELKLENALGTKSAMARIATITHQQITEGLTSYEWTQIIKRTQMFQENSPR